MAWLLPWLSFKRRNLTIAVILIILSGSCIYYYMNTGHHFPNRDFIRSITRHKKPNTTTLLDISNFTFIRNPKDICSGFQDGRKKSIVSIVHSARANFKSRAIIRSTHGSVPTYRGWLIQVVFAIGIRSTRDPEDETVEDLLEIEANQYGDIIVGDFEDTYRNLTYKHLMAYKWAAEYCPEANYYIKSDDDILVNIFHVIEFLSMPPGSFMSTSSNTSVVDMDKDFYCYFYSGTQPVRKPGKWQVTKREYSKEYYPNYCGLGIYVTSIRTIRKILLVSRKATFFWVDDIFVTGILREIANEERVVTDNSINILHGQSHYYPYIDNMTDVIASGNCLGVVTEQRSPNISCPIWNLILEAHDVMNLYISRCNSLL